MLKPTLAPAPVKFSRTLFVARLLCFSALALALCWLIVRHSVAAYLSTTEPDSALLLNQREPSALFTLAEQEINPRVDPTAVTIPPRPTSKRLQSLRELVETALVIDPLPARIYRLLGQIHELQGSAKRAKAFMRAAAQHSLHEGFAVHWLMQKSFADKNYAATAYYADALLRSGAAASQLVLPILTRMAEDKGAPNQEIKKLLAKNPPWRSVFFGGFYGYLTDARTPLDLFSSLKDSAAPATTQELNAYQLFLFQKKLYQLAYYVWLQFLPPDKLETAGFLFNGDFEAEPSGSPFDWQAPMGANATVDFATKPENEKGRALFVEFGSGRAEFPGVSQSIILAPGPYALKGAFRGELTGPRGLQWSVLCADGSMLGQSQMILGSFPDWRAFDFSFVVPEKECLAQSLQLKLAARSPSEQLVSGGIWFDGIQITRNQ